MEKMCNISELAGKTIISIEGMEEQSEEILFQCEDGSEYKMLHIQDCCESVYLEDVGGEACSLLNYPIVIAEDISSECDNLDPGQGNLCDASYTWTFYKLATIKGYVTLRWFGTSNGYYSESVNFIQTKKER